MQARIDVIMRLHEGFQADFTRTAQERIVGANVHLDFALAGLVMPVLIIKGGVGKRCFASITIGGGKFFLLTLVLITGAGLRRELFVERIGGMVSRHFLLTWHVG